MKITQLSLHNFRNFEDYNIEFGRKSTLLIGRNGMGKTNLISAIVKAMNFIFSIERNQPQFDFIASSDQHIRKFRITDARFNTDYLYPIIIEARAIIGEESIEWTMRQDGQRSGLRDSLFRPAYHQFWSYYVSRNNKPVLAYFSDGFPHMNTRISKPMRERLESGNPLPSNTGYYQWDEEQSCVEIWKTYYKMQWINNRTHPDPIKEAYINAVSQSLHDFTQPMGDDNNREMCIDELFGEVRGDEIVLMVRFENGDVRPFDSLPQGYNRIFSMVLDLANRGFFLNGNTNPDGIALIDEIELHLHPSIAANVLQRLQRIFPNMQFIASTHSPLVITNFNQNDGGVDDNRLYKLGRTNYGYFNERIEDVFGIDYNTGLTEIMETSASNPQVQRWVEAYQYWQSRDLGRANQIAAIIRQQYGQSQIVQRLGL